MGNVRYFFETMITYSNEKILDWTYLWKKLHKSVKFKNYGNNMTKDRDKCELSSFLVDGIK